MAPERKIRVLVVDDSVVVQMALRRILSRDSSIQVVGVAPNPLVARDKILELKPDVLTLDIEMPEMDGLTFLRIIMKERPMPVIIVSSMTQHGSEIALEALRCGAVDVLGKPSSSSVGDIDQELIYKIQSAANSRIYRAVNVEVPKIADGANIDFSKVILLGASTGGPAAIGHILTALPAVMPPICVVQHIPPIFSKTLAARLNTQCALTVKEAEEGDKLMPNCVYFAPGDHHMLLEANDHIRLNQGPKVCYQRPSVDILFKTAARVLGKRAVAGILTGMGNDGADGLLALKNSGALTFAQNEDTSVVYGMPKEAVRLGATQSVLPLEKIPAFLLDAVSK
ncbi:MAG: hypothetical protein A2Y14_01205 [Verrucomicrobia bacterium GWF2_51_19]|nr:MAG: hypothetical protein A2Y14_01205 [Verrucomicrobia bacterium GWF2_51_19]HCJ12201.1 chemotaxis response regulator protein-glutamate methylesterase [Opitutae bacterium]